MNDQIQRLLLELRGTACRCHGFKQPGQTFCRVCYVRLPAPSQKALYRRLGNGYEAAYAVAVELLGEVEPR